MSQDFNSSRQPTGAYTTRTHLVIRKIRTKENAGCRVPHLSLLLRKVGFHERIRLRIFVPRDEVRPIDSCHKPVIPSEVEGPCVSAPA